MTYEIYRYIFLGGAILSGIMTAVAIALFFALKIPSVIGDLTGANARKAIENIRSQNENTGVKAHKSSSVNKERGMITDRIIRSGTSQQAGTDGEGNVRISTQELTARQIQQSMRAEENGEETTVLSEYGTGNETTVLSEHDAGDETTVLGYGNAPAAAFTIEYEITLIHTQKIVR